MLLDKITWILNEILDINAQDEFEVKPTTTPRPKCERLPRENELFSSDNFPGNYKKVLHTQLLIMTDWIYDFSGLKLSLSHESQYWEESAVDLLYV